MVGMAGTKVELQMNTSEHYEHHINSGTLARPNVFCIIAPTVTGNRSDWVGAGWGVRKSIVSCSETATDSGHRNSVTLRSYVVRRCHNCHDYAPTLWRHLAVTANMTDSAQIRRSRPSTRRWMQSNNAPAARWPCCSATIAKYNPNMLDVMCH